MMNKNLTTLMAATLLAGAASALSGCGEIKRGEYAKGSATIFCDDGFRNVMDEEVEVFEFSYPDASIIPFYCSEEQAIDSLMADKTQAIVITRELTKDERDLIKARNKRVVKQQCIAVDAVALIVNKENPLNAVSMDEIRDLLNGTISSWSQLAANDTARVRLVFDSQGSSTVNYMREKFLPAGRMISDNPNAYAQKGNAEVFDLVKKDPEAIGIISVSWLGDNLENARNIPLDRRIETYKNENDTIATGLTTEVKVLKVSNPDADNDFTTEAYKPYQLYINSGEYPLFRKVFMISTASNSTVMHSFYTFVTGFVGQKIISMTGIMPYHLNRRVVQLTKK